MNASVPLLTRTRVYRTAAGWQVNYYMPYSGPSTGGPYPSWQEAWHVAEQVECERQWL